MLAVATTGYRLHGFAARNSTTNHVRVWLINKCDGPAQCARVTLPAAGVEPSSVASVIDDAGPGVPNDQRWGALTPPRPVVCAANVCEIELPPLSFSMLM